MRGFPMLRLDRDNNETVTFEFEGKIISAQNGDSIAAALVSAGHKIFRTTPISGAARGPLCMMGVCFECLVEIEGLGNQQACMREIKEGMKVKIQRGAVDIGIDLPISDIDKAGS